MTADEKFKDKVGRLLESASEFHQGWKFKSEQIEMIRDLANDCKGSGLYEATKDQRAEYVVGLTPEQMFQDMIFKIVEAPTTIHMLATIRLLIPAIYEKIQEELKEAEWFEGTELCANCGEEFGFIFYPDRGELVTCPHCGMIQHPCSLCWDCDNRCEENLHSLWKKEEEE